MRIAIIGSHGIPARYGGFETFAEHLSKSLADHGFEIITVNERSHKEGFSYPNVSILHSKYDKSESPMNFYRDSLSLVKGADVIISCGSAGSLYYDRVQAPVVITNIDGLEHKRRRYTWYQRFVVHRLQRMAIRRSQYVITDSDHVLKYWSERYPHFKNKMRSIPYGADECRPAPVDVLEKFSLVPNEYFLVISRLVPENNIREILNAFNHYKSNKKLVITGNVDSEYARQLKARADKRVIFTGGIYNKPVLDRLRVSSYLYIHGHSVGGTNPSLLEAMAAGCACICHSNSFNKETTGNSQEYFRESYDLAIHMNGLEHDSKRVEGLKVNAGKRIKDYSWQKLTGEYIALLHEVATTSKSRSA